MLLFIFNLFIMKKRYYRVEYQISKVEEIWRGEVKYRHFTNIIAENPFDAESKVIDKYKEERVELLRVELIDVV